MNRNVSASVRRLGAVCLLLCLLSSLLCGCGEEAPDPSAFTSTNFAAELRGRMTSPETGKVIELCVKAEVGTAGDARTLRVVYLAPDGLEGIEIEAICTVDGVLTDEATVRFGGIAVPTEAEQVSGLLLPVTSLFKPRALASIRRTEDGWEASYDDGARILTDANGHPRAFFSPEISFDVVWFDARGVQ